jgi:hypothetical protein
LPETKYGGERRSYAHYIPDVISKPIQGRTYFEYKKRQIAEQQAQTNYSKCHTTKTDGGTMKKKSALLDRWFPHPFVSVIVGLSWVMLSHSVWLTDILIAFFWQFLFHVWYSPLLHVHHIIGDLQSTIFVVLWDIVISNIRVAKLVLGPIDRYNLNGIAFRWKHNMRK